MNAVLEKKHNTRKSYAKTIQQYELWWADLGVGVGSEQGGIRPVAVTMGEIGCHFSPVITIVPISSNISKFKGQKTQVYLEKNITGLSTDSILLYEQVRSIDRARFTDRISKLPEIFIPLLEKAKEAQFNSKWA